MTCFNEFWWFLMILWWFLKILNDLGMIFHCFTWFLMVLHCFYELEWSILNDFVKITFQKVQKHREIVINASNTWPIYILTNSKFWENPCASFWRVPGPPNPRISLVFCIFIFKNFEMFGKVVFFLVRDQALLFHGD